MILQDIFDQLTHGELTQLAVAGDNGTGGIREEDKPRLIAHIQLALTALHKRFLLKEKRMTLELQPGKSSYVLKSLFAQSNAESGEPVKYIRDDEQPFQDDLLRVERILDDKGNELPINEGSKPNSIRTPSYNMLIVPEDLESETLTVVFRADHPKINPVTGQYVSFTEEIDLPVTHLEPLLYFVASRVMNPVGLSGEFHEGNNYAAKYEAACQLIEQHGFYLNDDNEEDVFQNSGWV